MHDPLLCINLNYGPCAVDDRYLVRICDHVSTTACHRLVMFTPVTVKPHMTTAKAPDSRSSLPFAY